MKSLCAESHQVLVTRAAHAAQNLQVIDALEEIRLALAVLSDDREPRPRNLQIELLEVAKVARRDAAQPDLRFGHFPPNTGARFSRNALIPSVMSSVAASKPK